ncbi:MAG: Na(+)-translocating NADH-quinone reductase subunit A [Bacteroidaceae bacterium]|nr:Na(+)-translocating NADH-quinone reductase subunit A [Bacteroidaceae bacterium]MBR6368044.1 Na(+)-translocating NADH-quinone reductase subunit A [Bacteroidaceae bacterium]
MAKVIKLRKGLDINLKGKATKETATVKCPGEYALVPDDFHGVKPKVVVKEGDAVKAGDALFVDKLHPEVKFVSPVSGTVSLVERGDRRKLLSIRVASPSPSKGGENGEEARQFTVPSKETGEAVKALMLESGLFAFLRQRPYDVVANPEDKPKAIFVSAFNSMPLSQDFEYVLQGQEAEFQAGLSALAKMAKVYLGVSAKQTVKALTEAKDCEVNIFDGPAPAGNVGVQINHVSPVNKGEVVWTMGAEEVIFLGRLVKTGKVDFTRTIALAGSEVKAPKYYKVKVGQKLTTLLSEKLKENSEKSGEAGSVRIINGNVMTGLKTTADGFLGAHATEVNVIPEGDHADEMLGWIMPRFNTFSTHRSYFSWLFGKKKEYVFDARIKGGERHMIMSGEYDKVFPMDIYAGYLVKAIIAGDIDRQEALGIYEVAPEDFAIAEFVDSSKLELQRIVREGLDILRKENA